MISNNLRKYPFSLFDMDGSREMWQNIYSPYIDLVEKKLNISDQSSIRTFRNYDFALNNAIPRIADLVILEIEDQKSNPISNKSGNDFNKKNEKIEDEYSNEIKQENNLKITFVFTNKKKQKLKLIQLLKLSGEVKKYTQLLHKKVLRQYTEIIPQMIFISLFGFETTVENYLRDNLHRNLNGSMSILIVPPIDNNNLWNNNFVISPIESKNGYKPHKSGMNFDDYNNLRRNGAVNQFQVKKMEAYFNDLKETNNISEYNSQQLKIWGDILSINKSSTLLDVKNSRTKIKGLIIE
jgi:hypothetical protein